MTEKSLLEDAPPAPPAPIVGDVVQYHYSSRGGLVHLAAIVVKVFDASSGCANLRVLCDGYTLDPPGGHSLITSVLRAGEYGQLGCWSPKR